MKFIFATTEIRKVPVTVLSRCQRFDLRRVEADVLSAHFAGIALQEGATISQEALKLIARAADGSVRDGLSLLDQAIAHGHGAVEADQVRDMLGLADRSLTFDLFEAAMQGKAADALDLLARQYTMGADPSTIVADLLELSHWLTRVRVVPTSADDPTLPEPERVRGKAMAETLPMAVLTRAWQILLKGLEETRLAPNPLSAAEMVLIRLIFAADLPTPAEALKALGNPPPRAPQGPGGGGGGNGGARMAMGGGTAQAAQAPQFVGVPDATESAPTASAVILPATFEALVGFLAEQREPLLSATLFHDIRLISYEPGKLVFRPKPGMERDFGMRLAQRLEALTQRRWAVIANAEEEGEATLQQQAEDLERRREAEAAKNPLVQAVIATFPDAAITRVRVNPDALTEDAATPAEAEWQTGESEE